MKMRTALLLVALSGMSAGCAGTGGEREVLTIRLQGGEQNEGAIAQATLVGRGDLTDITYLIGAVPGGVSRPLQLYTFIYPGSCAALSPEPAYSLNNTTHTTPTETGWTLSREAPVTLDALRSAPHALVVRTSPADNNLNIFCGDIR
ncbi:MAG: hypothetical protein KDI17_14855 [Halioglobus sp.]|nr:hypothetical protein [Halioglobus sp.]